jgi:hypothetical protein
LISFRKIISGLQDWMMFRFNIFSEVVEPGRFLSQQVIDILEMNGVHMNPGTDTKRVRCLLFNKRIIRLDRNTTKPKMFIPDWEFAGVRKKHELLNKAISVCYLHLDADAFEWDIAVYRDKESKKVSFFNFKDRTKTVVWTDSDHLNREVKATEHFSQYGVNVLGHEQVNREKNSLVQRLVGIPGDHSVDFNPVDDQMMSYVLKAAALKSIGREKADHLPIEIRELVDFAEQQIKKSFWVHNNQAPHVLVHGDLNPYNLLREDDKTWLIDFDRTFEASAYYDFVYVWLNKYDRSTEKLKNRIRTINDKFYGENIMSDTVALNLALALFVYDNIRFIDRHCDTIKDARFVIFLLNRLKDKWPRQQVLQE